MEKATKFVDGLDKESTVADYDVVQGELDRQGGGNLRYKEGWGAEGVRQVSDRP